MGIALQMYVGDWKVYPYYAQERYATTNVSEDFSTWARDLEPYYLLKWSNTAYHCPGYKGLIITQNVPPHWSVWSFGSYGYNENGSWVRNHFFVPNGPGYLGLGVVSSDLPPFLLKDSGALVPSQLLAFADSRIWAVTALGFSPGTVGSDSLSCGLLEEWSAQTYPLRHGKNYNVVFCDTHVEGMPPTTLFDPEQTAVLWNNDHKPHPEVW